MFLTAGRTVIFGLFTVMASQAITNTCLAKSITHHNAHSRHSASHKARFAAAGGHVIQCVAFAKQDAGIVIAGNARDWWYNAQGVYQRGRAPEVGSVLSFQENGRMPLGHVAVVSGVQDSRTILIDQSHWGRSGITRDIAVKDVSENNDWTAVRVQLGHGEAYGSIYPTHGFIYARPDDGTIVEASYHAPMPALDRAPADLRRTVRRHDTATALEVAELPQATRGLDLSVQGIATDAPDRGIR